MNEINRIAILKAHWDEEGINQMEQLRRIIDLLVVAVFLDAGAGENWSYKERISNRTYNRSEGIAVAVLEMFTDGKFSSDGKPYIVDSEGLQKITLVAFEEYFQSSPKNQLISPKGRVELLHQLGRALESKQSFLGGDWPVRPGFLLDTILKNMIDNHRTSVRVLWKGLHECFGSVFPDPNGLGLGDVYHHSALGKEVNKDSLVPFHKLLQWLCYSLIEPLSNFGINFVDTWLMTCLAEYRNGGLLVDLGCLVPKNPDAYEKEYLVDDEFIVEWRALTIAIIDIVADKIRARLGDDNKELSMSKILEGGTWRTGRQVAYELRPNGRPPFKVQSNGNVF